MSDSSSEEKSIVDLMKIITCNWKRLIIFSSIGGLVFFLFGRFVIPTKYYSEIVIGGEFKNSVDTEFGEFIFSSTSLTDYCNNILDKQIIEKTNALFLKDVSSTVQLEFKLNEQKDHVSGTLMAFSNNENIDLQAYLLKHFQNFLFDLNQFTFINFLQEVQIKNRIILDKTNAEINLITRNLKTYKDVSDSLKILMGSAQNNYNQSLPLSSALEELEVLSSKELYVSKQITLANLKVKLDHHEEMNLRIANLLAHETEKIEPLALFNQSIRIITPPSQEIKSISGLTFAFLGLFIGFLFGFFPLLAKVL